MSVWWFFYAVLVFAAAFGLKKYQPVLEVDSVQIIDSIITQVQRNLLVFSYLVVGEGLDGLGSISQVIVDDSFHQDIFAVERRLSLVDTRVKASLPLNRLDAGVESPGLVRVSGPMDTGFITVGTVRGYNVAYAVFAFASHGWACCGGFG